MWCEQLLSVILAYRVEEYVDGSHIVPSMYLSGAMIVSSEYYVWKRTNGMIRSWIFGSVTNEVSSYLYRKQSTYELWKTFEEVFPPLLNL